MKRLEYQKIKEALPDRAIITLIKEKSTCRIDFKIYPSISEPDFEMCKDWQREIIGRENISEFYTEETGSHWMVYLKRVPFEFDGFPNYIDKDSGFNIQEHLSTTQQQ